MNREPSWSRSTAPSPRTASETRGSRPPPCPTGAARSGGTARTRRRVRVAPAASARASAGPVDARGVGGAGVGVAEAAGGQHGRPGLHDDLVPAVGRADDGAGDLAPAGAAARWSARWPIRAPATTPPGRRVEHPVHLGTGGVSAGVDDPSPVVPALEAERQPAVVGAVEARPGPEQPGNGSRPLLDQHGERLRVAHPDAGRRGVGGVVGRVVGRVHHGGDAALCPGGAARAGVDQDDPANTGQGACDASPATPAPRTRTSVSTSRGAVTRHRPACRWRSSVRPRAEPVRRRRGRR